ncbi:MAG TPA: exo-alpha-sialidase [Lacipirellulaceae bacterium]|nr:exo-alpha-sialidase [Lacipirellulaceae bacterium]
MIRIFLLTAVLLAVPPAALGDPPAARIVDVQKIWDQAPHNAFTDLLYWNGQFLCAFREGRSHVSTDGTIRILTSIDGTQWTSAAVVRSAGYDLRDAELCVTPAGALMLFGGAATRKVDNELTPTGTFAAFSRDGYTWYSPTVVVPQGRWMWRVTWHGGKAYGVSYAAPDGKPWTSLLSSEDGIQFREIAPKMCGDGYPTEAVLRFDDGETLYCLQRRDGAAPQNSALLGISRAPYTDWQWHDLKMYFGGPNFIQIPDGRWIAAGRIIQPDAHKTEIAWLDVENNELKPILQLPSGGDTSYPGLVWHDDLLWVSYYSSHEGKTSIYLAKVEIK